MEDFEEHLIQPLISQMEKLRQLIQGPKLLGSSLEQGPGLPTRHVIFICYSAVLCWAMAMGGTKSLSVLSVEPLLSASHCLTPWPWLQPTHCTLWLSVHRVSPDMWREIGTQTKGFSPGLCMKRILSKSSIPTALLPLLTRNLINHVCIWIQTRQ